MSENIEINIPQDVMLLLHDKHISTQHEEDEPPVLPQAAAAFAKQAEPVAEAWLLQQVKQNFPTGLYGTGGEIPEQFKPTRSEIRYIAVTLLGHAVDAFEKSHQDKLELFLKDADPEAYVKQLKPLHFEEPRSTVNEIVSDHVPYHGFRCGGGGCKL